MKPHTSQLKPHKTPTKPAIPIQSILDNPLQGLLDNTNKTDRYIIDTLLGYHSTHRKGVWVSQSTIAKAIGRSRQYVNQRIKHLVSIGLLSSTWNAWVTNDYEVTSFIKMKHIAEQLYTYLPRLKNIVSLSLSLLLSGCLPHLREGIRNPGFYSKLDTTKLPSIKTEYLPKESDSVSRISHPRTHPLPIITGNTGKCIVNKWGNTEDEQIAIDEAHKKGDDVTIRESIESKPAFIIQGLKLSIKGRIELSCFDEDTVAEAGKQLIRVEKTARDYMRWMIGACTNEYRRADKQPDYALRDFLRKQITILGKLPLWVHATPEEIALFTPERAKTKFSEQWQGHIAKDDLTTVVATPSTVQANVELLKKSPFLQGMDIARMFAAESEHGEVVPMSYKRLQHQARRALRDTKPNATMKSAPESITSDKKELSNVIDIPPGQSFKQIERGCDTDPTMQVGVPQERHLPEIHDPGPSHSFSQTKIC